MVLFNNIPNQKNNKNAAKWNCDKISVLDYDKMAAKPKKRKKDLQ